MFVTNWISTTKIQKISEITNFFKHYFLSRTEVMFICSLLNLYAKKMQTSAMKACFQIAECSFSYAKILKIFQIYK